MPSKKSSSRTLGDQSKMTTKQMDLGGRSQAGMDTDHETMDLVMQVKDNGTLLFLHFRFEFSSYILCRTDYGDEEDEED